MRWNTQASPHPSAAPAAIQSARVTAVQGTRIIVLLRDGSTRAFTTTPAQARELRSLIGTIVEFRIR